MPAAIRISRRESPQAPDSTEAIMVITQKAIVPMRIAVPATNPAPLFFLVGNEFPHFLHTHTPLKLAAEPTTCNSQSCAPQSGQTPSCCMSRGRLCLCSDLLTAGACCKHLSSAFFNLFPQVGQNSDSSGSSLPHFGQNIFIRTHFLHFCGDPRRTDCKKHLLDRLRRDTAGIPSDPPGYW